MSMLYTYVVIEKCGGMLCAYNFKVEAFEGPLDCYI